MSIRFVLAALLIAFAPLAAADKTVPTVDNMSVQEFLAFHDGVAERARGRDFAALSRSEAEQLASAQATLRQRLEGRSSMADLDDATKLEVFNAHEKVVALVNKAEDERMVCTQKKRLGSHRHQLECRTVAQVREDRERARAEQLRRATGACSFNCNGG